MFLVSAPQEYRRVQPGPGQEPVWDSPRPPRLEPTSQRVEVWFNGEKIVDTTRAWRVLETSHPPVYYIPIEDVHGASLRRMGRSSLCECKGQATSFDVVLGDRVVANAVWSYQHPTTAFASIAGHVALYAEPMDECRVEGAAVHLQPGDFHGGWITPDIVGPFKGEPGSRGW